MGRGFLFGVVFMLMLPSAFAQAPSAGALPPGAQNPALVQPQLAAPPSAPSATAAQPVVQPPPASDSTSPSALIVPGGAGGLCECLINHDAPGQRQFDKTRMHQSCLANVDACQAACNTDHYYSFVPHANYTCPARPDQGTGHIAMNALPAMRLLGRR